MHACDVPCANRASRDRRSPLHNQMFIAEEPILVNTFFSIFRPYGMYEAMYQTRAHLRPKVKPRIAPYKTRQTLPGCRAPLNANEEEHDELWAARKSANHRGNLRRPRIGVCRRQETLVSAGGYGVPSRRYRPPSLALASPGTSACTVSSVRSESCHMQPGVCAALRGARAAGARACAVESVPCAAKRDHISKGVDDAERPNVPTWGGHGAQQALRHARQVRGVQECYSLQNDMKPRKLKTMPVHMQAMHPRTRSLKDMLGHSAFFSGSTVACSA